MQTAKGDKQSDEESLADVGNQAVLAGLEVPSPVFFCSLEPPVTGSSEKPGYGAQLSSEGGSKP